MTAYGSVYQHAPRFSIGVVVTSLITLPKFIEARAPGLRSTFFSISNFEFTVPRGGANVTLPEHNLVPTIVKGQNLSGTSLTELRSAASS
jgi:hypothetical protein